ncbi:DNA repair protein RecO [Rubritalea marina]|uniref:DNA repair protein RecO n=1 Tax=Rubritalea marina TaxID=361055 RepID=UPI00036E546D|nr:DNA repair protein RecO [Rubritalea marina]
MHNATGIIIRLTKLSDTSLIVNWCVDGVGLVRTVAKGARRPKSSFAGNIDLFYLAELQWSESTRSDLHGLRELRVENRFEGLRGDYKKTLMASYFSALVSHVLEEGVCDDAIFDLLKRALAYVSVEEANLKAFDHFEKQLAKCTGVWDGRRRANLALEDAFGKLPILRKQCRDSVCD